MNQHRKVQSIGRGPQSFSRSAQSPIQSPMQPMGLPVIGQQQPIQQQSPDSAVEAMQDLAMEIYSQLAIDLIRSSQTTNLDLLRQMAKHSQVAALAYFEELGVEFAEQSQEKV